MKRKRLVIIICTFLAAVILGALLWPREREPEYNGLTISKWLNRWVDGQSEGFVYAVSEMGTNAIPFLLRAVSYEKSRWKSWAEGTIRHLPDSLVDIGIVDWLIKDKAHDRANSAMFGFMALGRKAEPVLPELRRLTRSKDSDTSQRAVACISAITNGVPLDVPLKLKL